jgi:Flp pilus assembly protein TadB
LATANACISSLEAELEASRKAWDVATATKATAEKATKSALAKVKKMEKDLSDANKEHLQREQAMTERLKKISAAAGGTCYAFLVFHSVAHFLYLLMFAFSAVFVSWLCRIY